MQSSGDMSTASTKESPFVLVLGLDLADTVSSGYAFDQAARIVARIPGSRMHVVYALAADTGPEKARAQWGLLRLYVAEKANGIEALEKRLVGVHVRAGDAAHEIAQLAEDVDADLVVLGTGKRPDVKKLLLGSTSGRVMALTSRPVLVAGPRPRPEPSHVIVIEPPCPDCVIARSATQGRTWWCARHAEHHHLRRHHVYSYQTELPFEEHDSEVIPTGV